LHALSTPTRAPQATLSGVHARSRRTSIGGFIARFMKRKR